MVADLEWWIWNGGLRAADQGGGLKVVDREWRIYRVKGRGWRLANRMTDLGWQNTLGGPMVADLQWRT